MTETDLEPGSPAARLTAFFKQNPGEHLSRADVAMKLGITPAYVDTAVEPAVIAALVTVATNDEGRIWRAGPMLKHLPVSAAMRLASAQHQPEPAAVAPAPPRRVQTTMQKRGGPRKALPPLDIDKLPVRTGSPLPDASVSLKGVTRHDAVFDALVADGMSREGIPLSYQHALQKAALTYMAQRPLLQQTSVLRVLKIDDQTCGVWRVAKPSLADAPAARRAA